MMHIIGKDLTDVSWYHEDLINQEHELLSVQLKTEELYASNPLRLNCILCGYKLEGPKSYSRGTINYIFCRLCGHVNGNHIVNTNFISSTYTSDKLNNSISGVYDSEFTSGKMADEYWSVVERIYKPKANFLKEFLQSEHIDISTTSILDVGCGSGHFVNALLESGFKKVTGIDSFDPAVSAGLLFGRLGSNQISCVDPGLTQEILSETNAAVVSMMCVLVHLDSPVRALELMSKNKNIKYTYQKIPLWSFACMLEALFPEHRARVLGSDHTNVFTHDSLKWIEQTLNLRRVASWTFGADYLDLLRKMQVGMIKNGVSLELIKKIDEDLKKVANDIQLKFDENMLGSEIHLIWEFPH